MLYMMTFLMTMFLRHSQSISEHKLTHFDSFLFYVHITLTFLPLNLPRMYSIVPSSTRFNRGSKPFRTPLAEREIHSVKQIQ